MDIGTHALFGVFLIRALNVRSRAQKGAILAASVLPDLGEIPIQMSLSEKYGARMGVYDPRTSDVEISNDLATTWLYDLTHSLTLTTTLLAIAAIIFAVRKKPECRFWSIPIAMGAVGHFGHVLLDSCTHGVIWALKFVFPLSNQRLPILAESVGTWWEWEPKVELPILNFGFPLWSFAIWFALGGAALLIGRLRRDKERSPSAPESEQQ